MRSVAFSVSSTMEVKDIRSSWVRFHFFVYHPHLTSACSVLFHQSNIPFCIISKSSFHTFILLSSCSFHNLSFDHHSLSNCSSFYFLLITSLPLLFYSFSVRFLFFSISFSLHLNIFLLLFTSSALGLSFRMLLFLCFLLSSSLTHYFQKRLSYSFLSSFSHLLIQLFNIL